MGLAIGLVGFDVDRGGRLEEALQEREEAGRGALAALKEARVVVAEHREAWWSAERRAAEHRASELALFATLGARGARGRRLALPPSWEVGEGEAIGLVDLERDRILEFTGAEHTAGATLSVALPTLAGALQSQPRGRVTPLIVREGSNVWGVGTPFAEAVYVVARVELEAPPASAAPLARAERALGNLVAPELPPGPPGGGLPWIVLGIVLGSFAAALWAHRRWIGPLTTTLDAARAFVHGEPDARADELRGGRDARDVARTVNALIERAERLKAQGRAARREDVTAAAAAIHALGQGDLRSPAPQLGETFVPIARAIDDARRGLLERVTTLHEVAADVARGATDARDAARSIHQASTEQRDALRRLGEGADEAARQLVATQDELDLAIEQLAAFADEHRRGIRAVRTSLRSVGRRVQDVGAGAARIDALVTSTPKIESALALLADLARRLAGSDVVDDRTRTKVSAAAGEAKASLDVVRRELTALADELRSSGDVLGSVLADQPDPPGEVDGRVRDTLRAAATTLVRTGELAATGLRTLEGSSSAIASGANALATTSARARDRLPALHDAFAQIRVGASFEEALLERLGRARAEVVEGRATNNLTEDGRAMIEEVERASRDARARLAKLIEATEQAATILRG